MNGYGRLTESSRETINRLDRDVRMFMCMGFHAWEIKIIMPRVWWESAYVTLDILEPTRT